MQEAIVLLEQARMEYDEMPMRLYLNLSLHLAKAYMIYFELNKEKRFALIAQQILKPLAHHHHSDIYFSWLMLRQRRKNQLLPDIGLQNIYQLLNVILSWFMNIRYFIQYAMSHGIKNY